MESNIYDQNPADTTVKQREREQLGEQSQKTEEKTKQSAEALKQRVEQSAQDTGRQAKEMIDERKSMLSQSIDSIADALDTAAQQLDRKNHRHLADYGRRVSGGIHQASQALSQRSPEQLWQDTTDLARRYPAVTIGSMFAAGLAVSRFFKASEPQNR